MTVWTEALILLVATILFYLPVIAWPPDPHFGSNSMWALFRKPGEPLPEEVVLGNAGCSRIFLHYFVLAAVRVFGRRHLHVTMRSIQAAAFFLTALILCLASQAYLGIAQPFAVTAGLLLLFTASRPQLEPTYLNAEPFYALAQAAGMACLYAGLAAGWPCLGLGTYSFLLVFAALNTKPPFLAEPLAVGCAFWMVTGNTLAGFVAFAVGSLAGAGLFAALMRQHLHPGAYSLMNSYHSTFRGGLKVLWGNLKSRWRNGLCRSPLGGLALLAALGTLLPPWDGPWFLTATWMGVAALLLALQFRFELYHFLIALPPACLLTGRALALTWDIHPLFGVAVAGAAVALMAKSLTDFPFYYGKASVEKKMARALPGVFPHYFDLRMDSMVKHFRSVSTPEDRFVAWGIVPQVYYLADVPPVSTYTFFHHWMDFLLPRWKDILLNDLKRTRPRWLYDFSTWNKDHGRFNPLAMFASTGLRYLPHSRFENVVCYRLQEEGTTPEPPLDRSWPLYVYRSPLADFLRQELGLGSKDALPDLARLVTILLDECWTLPSGIEQAILERLDQPTPWGILESYGAAILLKQGDTAGATKLLARPCTYLEEFLRLSPSFALAREALNRCAESNTGLVAVKALEINRLPAGEALAVVSMARAMAKAGLLQATELEQAALAMRDVQTDGGAWSFEEVETMLLAEASVFAHIETNRDNLLQLHS